jgi:hypothetical protein
LERLLFALRLEALSGRKRIDTFAVPSGTKAVGRRCSGGTLPGDKAVTSYSDRDTERSDVRQAYELGRRDAAKQRRRHPILMVFTVIAAAVGIIVLALAAVNGSFSGAGSVVDQNLATVADQAEPVVRGAAAEAGQTVRDVTSTDRTESPARN